ncbi:MAG: trehalose-phosphatase [Microbacteriaceae bacterium]|jgi:trehalose 6-phosphate phosphatase|nr:trehalose-phosphatase [Microbacteriaceae bacterium]HOA86572.1 trehalose-phosphatase [Microbacteriaceae bacterium]HPZ34361.1 trehalose-phosphatase [Microbacteriaceae bacterium]HQC93281.1 trehalose-phosphatase [Microbacteriaceae bacterium]
MTADHPFPDATLAAIDAVAATPTLLVALDFDGTLSPLHDVPMDARATPGGVEAVAELAALPRTVVALVSGRTLRDLRIIAEHADDSPVYLAGSHGAEVRVPIGFEAARGAASASGADFERAPVDASAEEALRDELYAAAVARFSSVPGAWIEPKRFGFGVHVRLATPEDGAAVMAGADALVAERAPHWRRRTGKNIVEYAFRHEGKDTAIAELRAQTGATAVFFAGDDVTDEDALRALLPGDLGVRVGEGETVAPVRVRDPEALAALLMLLVKRRRATAP